MSQLHGSSFNRVMAELAARRSLFLLLMSFVAALTLVVGAERTARAAPGVGSTECNGVGAGGWTFSASVSPNNGLELKSSTFDGRQYTGMVSVPYLDGLYTDHPALSASSDPFTDRAAEPQEREHRLELTPTPSLASPGTIGSRLTSFECVDSGDGDMFARAVYLVDDSSMYGPDPGGMVRYGALQVTQEYRFRGIDSNRCEPTGRLACARFWPSLSYESLNHPVDATACRKLAGDGSGCTAFRGVRTVQRMQFRPDGKDNGGVDAFRERARREILPARGGVETKGDDGRMKYEDIDTAIREGRRGDWDSIHQSPDAKTTVPGVDLNGLAPGCGACVHMHWVWGTSVNIPGLDLSYTDGKPQILDGSTQTADFGIVRAESGEDDPVGRGWRSLVDKKRSKASELKDRSPIVYWEMTSSGQSDSTFPVLVDYKHGGNGALFFGGHAH